MIKCISIFNSFSLWLLFRMPKIQHTMLIYKVCKIQYYSNTEVYFIIKIHQFYYLIMEFYILFFIRINCLTYKITCFLSLFFFRGWLSIYGFQLTAKIQIIIFSSLVGAVHFKLLVNFILLMYYSSLYFTLVSLKKKKRKVLIIKKCHLKIKHLCTLYTFFVIHSTTG